MLYDSFLKFCCKCIYHILVSSFRIARIVGNLIIILRWLSSSFVVATAMPCTQHIISVNSNIKDRTHIAQCWTYSKLHNHKTFSISSPLSFLSLSSAPLPLAYSFSQSQKSHVCFWGMKWDDILSWWVWLFGFMNSLIHLLFHFHFTCFICANICVYVKIYRTAHVILIFLFESRHFANWTK